MRYSLIAAQEDWQEFCGENLNLPSRCKLQQVNETDLYAIGGQSSHPHLMSRKYYVPKSCFKINILTGEFQTQSNMLCGRYSHGICSIRHLIFVAGGCDYDDDVINSCEVFNTIANSWTQIPSMPGPYTDLVTMEPASKRFVFVFGGTD